VDSSESARRVSVLLHAVLFASLGVYVVILLILRGSTRDSTSFRPAPPGLFPVLAAVGAAQFVFASWAGRAILRSRRSPAGERVRRHFLLRGASAEAIGLYGLLAGLQRAPWEWTAAFFVMAAVALAVCAPTRGAWAQAVEAAQSPGA
jgi:hypothetical protein